MKITALKEQKNNKEKVSLFIDDRYSFGITKNAIIEYGLYIGMDIDQEILNQLQSEDKKNLAFYDAINCVSSAMKTTEEVRKKLISKKYTDEEINYAMEKIEQYGYLNDDEYVDLYIKTKAIQGKKGSLKILYDLYKKGISKDIAQEKISKLYEEDTMKQNALEIATSKYEKLKEKEDDLYKLKQKIYAFLAQKGFTYEIIDYVMRKLF